MPVELERPKFLVDLLAEVDAFDAVYPSHDPVEKDETPRGKLTPWLVKAYSLSRYYHKQTRLLAIEHEYASIAADPEIAEMKYKCHVLMEITSCCIRAGLNLWTEPNVGVRENFTVIRSEDSDDEDGFKKFLRSVFGK